VTDFLYADGRFIILDEDGALGLATPAPNGLTDGDYATKTIHKTTGRGRDGADT